MIVDVGRRCRVSDMYFFTTGETVNGEPVVDYTRPTKVRWYNAPPGARQLPFFAFGGADYLSEYEKCMEGFGETVFGQKKWSNGKAPVGATGQHFCGTQADFQIPKVWSPDLPTIERGPTGLPLCCNDALRNAMVWTTDAVVNGNLILGGRIALPTAGRLQWETGVVSTICPGNLLPAYLTAVVTSDVSGLPFNGATIKLTFGVDLGFVFSWSGSIQVGPFMQRAIVQIQPSLTTGKLIWDFQYGSNPPISSVYGASNPAFAGQTCSPFSFTDTATLFQLATPIGNLTLSVS